MQVNDPLDAKAQVVLLNEALYCPDCQVISNCRQCPKCCSHAQVLISTLIDPPKGESNEQH